MTSTLPTTNERIRVAVNRRIGAVKPTLEHLFHADLATDLDRARRLAKWLDSEFAVGGYRFGFETILGAVPVVGDAIATLIGVFPIFVARRHRLGKWVQVRMAANLGVEFLLGSVPFVGDAFDTLMKANLRNLRLLERAAAKRIQ